VRTNNPRKPLFIAAFCALATYLAVGRLSPLDAWRFVTGLHDNANRSAFGRLAGDAIARNYLHAKKADLGQGQTVLEQRTLQPFDGIVLRSDADVMITVGDQASVAVATSDEDRNGRISADVVEGKLVIRGRSHNGSVAVTVPHLRSLQVSGGGNASLAGLKDPIAISVSGRGNVKASGRIPSLDLVVTGPGNFELSALQAEDARIVILGPGNASVFASRNLNATVLGPGHICYLGDPMVTENILGPGSVGRSGQG